MKTQSSSLIKRAGCTLSLRENADCSGENSKAFAEENKGNQDRQLWYERDS